jgi:hypothetical protein
MRPRRAGVDCLDQQGTEHPVGIGDTRLSDALAALRTMVGAACWRKRLVEVTEARAVLVNRAAQAAAWGTYQCC